MAGNGDARGFAGHAEVGELGDEDAVLAGAGGFAGPQLAVARPEGNAGVGGGVGRDIGEFGAGGPIE